jgi:hypothetical protein
MPDLSRRGFLSGSAGAAVAGAAIVATPSIVTAAPAIANAVDDQPATAAEISAAGPVVVHVRDAVAGEVSVLSGEQEVIFHDPRFVARVVAAAGGRIGS